MQGETLRSKKTFEQHADQFGVKFKCFLAENIPIGSADLIQDITDNNQTLYLSQIGAYNHNEVAKLVIQAINI